MLNLHMPKQATVVPLGLGHGMVPHVPCVHTKQGRNVGKCHSDQLFHTISEMRTFLRGVT